MGRWLVLLLAACAPAACPTADDFAAFPYLQPVDVSSICDLPAAPLLNDPTPACVQLDEREAYAALRTLQQRLGMLLPTPADRPDAEVIRRTAPVIINAAVWAVLNKQSANIHNGVMMPCE